VVPNLPLMASMREAGWAVTYLGAGEPEASLVEAQGIDFQRLPAGKLRRYFSLENLLDAFRTLGGIWRAFFALRRLKPAVVFSKGGYVGFPVVVGAWLNRVPVVAHESDLTPGLANRLSLPFVAAVCVNFADTHFKTDVPIAHTGTPLRVALVNGSAERGRSFLDVQTGQPILLVVGGSLGAQAVNKVVREALAVLGDYFVVHVCGPGRRDETLAGRPGYRQLEYVTDDWGDVLAAAELVISRAGANALFELVALGKPHVLVPLTRRASRGDQIENAEYAERQGWSFVLSEEALTPASLRAAVDTVAGDIEGFKRRLADAGLRDGTQAIVAEIERYAK
jgi:UDP-N-acetylglucosamine--N-acetylmuramyl-(pentapeptide) pyrophosphoryl-undecaprenol N-acetylglucosamine transferase